ncbi:uncharacterized protein LOC127880246 [Dreissena polymorpha]|uniref:Uncharacterized protein n=1 Tax=Dreissena polymorpha TaxID=45954 RepID=A0A9D4KKI2_DREPO|nr:uncharacterized protein LOC127879414 [Dreissena polymorpha]XP_052283521.1 uncharacterized protein LOC127880246 [Dreissena polymorpha]KAH3841159.1 hypothetical protein DPMN_114617 [Dreissena polymorpha]
MQGEDGSEEKKYTSVRPKRYNRKIKLTPYSTRTVPTPFDSEHVILQNTNTNIEAEPSTSSQVCEQSNVHQHEKLAEDSNCEKNLDFGKTIKELLEEVNAYNEIIDEVPEICEDTELLSDNEGSDCEIGDSFDFEDNTHTSTEDVPLEDRPIYSGHSMTVGTSLLLILLYTITHEISGSQLSDLLVLIGLHCAEEHPGLKSLFHFKKHFAGFKSPLVKHYFCIHCLTCVNENDQLCTNTLCGKSIKDSKSKSYFIEVPLESQLLNFFNRPNFAELLKHRFQRKKKKPSNLEDIYDGELYKKLSSKGGVLSDSFPYNISFTLNTDGVPLFKSSKFSIWPVFLMINELPFKYRRQSENMLFAGLWFGDGKPFMGTFFRPIHSNLKKLEDEGLNITVCGNDILCKAFLICSTADLPAKSTLLNMNQFNGAFSCLQCCNKGETFKTPGGGSVHVFPYEKEKLFGFGNNRTPEMCQRDAIEAVNTKQTVHGIKGPSFFMTFKYYDFVKSSSIDYMHGVLLGVTKLLIKLWFSTSLSKQDFSISCHSEAVDKKLLSIKPPSFVTRIPRSITSHFKYWKASELRSWLFFYSLPLLHGLLGESFYLHYACFVEAVFLLCGSSVTPNDIVRSQQLLMYFVMTFQPLYGGRYMTLNIHQLLHLPDCVRQLGPLWAYSCFYFETANGDITKLFHGTQNVDLQILSSVNIIQTLPTLIDKIPEHFKSAAQKLLPAKISKHISTFHVQFLGKGYQRHLADGLMHMLIEMIHFDVPNLTFYSRVLLRGELYHSKDYTRVVKRNSFTVKYFCAKSCLIKFGYIERFVTHEKNNKVIHYFALVRVAESNSGILSDLSIPNTLAITVPHIHKIKPTDKIDVVDLNNLLGICVNIVVPKDDEAVTFVCEPPNRLETD